MKRHPMILIAAVLAIALTAAACSGHESTAAKANRAAVEAQNASTAQIQKTQGAYFPKFSLERRNINEKHARFDNPNLIGYVTVMTPYGGIVFHGTVRGKISAVSSQVTPADGLDCQHYGNHDPRPDGCGVVQIPEPDGSWSTNGEGFFWFDDKGAYHELEGPGIAIYSDQEQILTTPPILTINAHAVQDQCDVNGNNCKGK